ncbi:hypothetical protein ACFWNF_36760 [Streptomyces anulatus]|uniref:hypothetical protein n=1 Tax=Streptomyces anulatus TaxID=1892 RepID=UPI00365BEF0E
MVDPVQVIRGGERRVIAVGAGFMWQLGTSFAEALTYVVEGDGGADRTERAAWL